MTCSETSFDVLTVGNATIDAFLRLHNAELHCRIDKKNCELCVRYGEKIPLDGCDFQIGGNATNVGVGLQRAGYRVGLMAEIGDDEFAQKIINGLQKEGLDLTHIQQKGQSSFAIGLQFQDERTLFVQHQQREHDFSFVRITANFVYLTSIGNEWESAYKKTLQFVDEQQCLLAFNPGTVQIQKGLSSIQEVLSRSDLVFLNKEEAERLLTVSGKRVEELLGLLRKETKALIVMTNGNDGAYALTSENVLYHSGTIEAEVVEKTGAGDAFASGFLASYLREKDVKKALISATVNAVSVLGKVGSQPGLLKKEEYEAAMKNAPEVTTI